MKKGRFICLIGIDGSGKTTLAKFLADTTFAENTKYRYVYARFLPVLVKPLWAVGRRLFLNNHDISADYRDYTDSKKSALSKSQLGKLHELAILIDYWIQVFMKITIPLLFGRNLVSDRYLYDTVVSDLATDLSYSEDDVLTTIQTYEKLMPKPDLLFLLDVPNEISLKRKNDIPSQQYLDDRRSIYQQISRSNGAIVINGSLSLEQVQQIAFSAVKTRFEMDGI